MHMYMSNHILLFFTKMFQSLLWPSSWCFFLQLVQKGRCMNILENYYFRFSKIIIWLWMNNHNKKGICFLNWFMTYNYTTHAPNSAPSIFLTTYLTPSHTQFSCDPCYWVQFHLSNMYVIIVTTVLPIYNCFIYLTGSIIPITMLFLITGYEPTTHIH